MKTIILGSNGYGGMLLLRILANHPQITSIVAASRSQAGQPLVDADPGLSSSIVQSGKISPIVAAPEDALSESADLVFSALPHGASAEVCAPILGSVPLIDLSADFRFHDEERFARGYGTPRPQPAYQDRSVYGLVEWYRSQIANAAIIANPGCYPTATLLPLLPLAVNGLIAGPIVGNALSGITGAGRKGKVNTLYGERTENANAYNPGTLHRHHGEIAERIELWWRRNEGNAENATGFDTTASSAPPRPPKLLFTPHLVPMKQGMAVTSVVPVTDPTKAITALSDHYADEPFVELSGDRPPETREVRGTNRVRIGWRVEGETIILMSVIDNLWKGASGQAVQNMNVRFGFSETTGLLREGDL